VETREPQAAPPLDVTDDIEVRAAGGVVIRHDDSRLPNKLVLLVHRPRYDDWTLPKGKLDRGESDQDAALREVEEETGLRCTLGVEAGQTRYRDAKGREKLVTYWLMAAEDTSGAFSPNSEVDELRWCTRAESVELLTYRHDRRLLEDLPPDVL